MKFLHFVIIILNQFSLRRMEKVILAKQSIINALENFENEVDISEYNISKDDMSGIVTDIIEENPQLFYVNREYKVSD